MKSTQHKDTILIIDDSPNNLEIAGKIIQSAGYDVVLASNGHKGLYILNHITPTLILLDIMMPDFDGIEVCKKIKQLENMKEIPIIFLTALTETNDITTAFKVGGVDYITKPFFKEEFLARIKNHIELYQSKRKISLYMKTINLELQRASEYIFTLLPVPLRYNNIIIDYYFKPTIALGGDFLGYHFIDEDNLAIYLIDVAGHGIGASLHSVSIINSIRYGNLSETNFKKPIDVLTVLNKIYQMNQHNNFYFTLWYACLNLKTKELRYASAGHPPAILIDKENVSKMITVDNFIIGGTLNYDYKDEIIDLKDGDSLYIFSDGVYELKNEDNEFRDIEDLRHFLLINKDTHASELDLLYKYQVDFMKDTILSDDFSIIKVWIKD